MSCQCWLSTRAGVGYTPALVPTGPWDGQPGHVPHLPSSGTDGRDSSTTQWFSSAPPPKTLFQSNLEPPASCCRYSTCTGNQCVSRLDDTCKDLVLSKAMSLVGFSTGEDRMNTMSRPQCTLNLEGSAARAAACGGITVVRQAMLHTLFADISC